MSNHFSAAYLKFPGDDARLDLTDLYVFPAVGDPDKTVLIIDVNPFTAGLNATPSFLMKPDFHPDGVYRINIDNDGDLQAEVAFTFVFSEYTNGAQTGTVHYATGGQARQPELSGDVLFSSVPVGFDADAQPVQAEACRLFIGVRSDPFFADAEAAPARIPMDGPRRLRQQECAMHRTGSSQRHARPRARHRRVGDR